MSLLLSKAAMMARCRRMMRASDARSVSLTRNGQLDWPRHKSCTFEVGRSHCSSSVAMVPSRVHGQFSCTIQQQQQRSLSSSGSTRYIPHQSKEAQRATDLVDDQQLQTAKRLLEQDDNCGTTFADPTWQHTFRETLQELAKHQYKRTAEDATDAAEQLLERLLEYYSSSSSHDDNTSLRSFLLSCLETPDSPNGVLVSLLEQSLVSFRGTHQTQAVFTTTDDDKTRSRADMWRGLQQATRLAAHMVRLHQDTNLPQLMPDLHSCHMMLNLWNKRMLYIREYGLNATTHNDHGTSQDDQHTATTVQDCIVAMEDYIQQMEQSEDYPSPSMDAYGLLITGYVQTQDRPYLEKAQQVLMDQIRHSPTNTVHDIPFHAILYGLAREAASTDSARYLAKTRDFFRFMQECPQLKQPLSVVAYSTLLLGLCNAGEMVEAQTLLERLEDQWSGQSISYGRTQHYPTVQPNLICYNTVLQGWANSQYKDAATRAEQLLHTMLSLSESLRNIQATPDRVSFTSVIEAISSSEMTNIGSRAEGVLQFCQQHAPAQSRPDTIMYNAVLVAWAEQSERDCRELDMAQSNYSGHRDSSLMNLDSSYGATTAVPTNAAQRAEVLLRRMADVSQDNTTVKPDVVSYLAVMQAWAKCPDPVMGVTRCRELLEEMRASGDESLTPNTMILNIVLGIVARAEGIDAAEEFLDEMKKAGNDCKVDNVTHNTYLDALVRSERPGAAQQAEEYLNEMSDAYRNGRPEMRPTSYTYNIVLNGYAKSDDPDAAQHAERVVQKMMSDSAVSDPSSVSYSTVLNVYARGGSTESAGKAVDLLGRMMDGSSSNSKPNTISFNTVIHALARSNDPDAPEKAETLLQQMIEAYKNGDESVRPTPVTYTSVMNCWAQSSVDGAAERTEAMLEQMERDAANKVLASPPNVFSYSTVINAWARSGHEDAVHRAIQTLEKMEQMTANGDKHAIPNAVCYNATLNAIARSQLPDKALRARALLDRMLTVSRNGTNKTARPNTTSFSTVINACAHSSGPSNERIKVFRIACKTFNEFMRGKYGAPTTILYVNYLMACSRLLPGGGQRSQLARDIYDDCAKRRLTNKKVNGLLQYIVSWSRPDQSS